MIVKKLRDRRGWTQEQLVECCGLNVRTIQRVESGNKASLETLQSLASVFEVDVSTLTEEITVIDKKSEDWKDLPWWFRANMFGIYTKRTVVWVELALVVVGVLVVDIFTGYISGRNYVPRGIYHRLVCQIW